MLSKIIVSVALLATSALGAAVPATTEPSLINIGDVLAVAKERGIDVHGPIPADATPVEGGFAFEADSDAAVWVRAQAGLPISNDLTKRENSGIKLGMFSGFGCSGNGVFIQNLKYDTQSVAPDGFVYNSLSLAGRGVLSSEQIDFSARSGGDLCAIYQGSLRGISPGCYNEAHGTCVRLIRI